MFQEAMNLEKEVKDLDGEIQELFEYQNMQEQRRLNRIAALFLPITLIASFFGMNTFGGEITFKSFLHPINIIIFAGMIIVFIIFSKDIFKRKK